MTQLGLAMIAFNTKVDFTKFDQIDKLCFSLP